MCPVPNKAVFSLLLHPLVRRGLGLNPKHIKILSITDFAFQELCLSKISPIKNVAYKIFDHKLIFPYTFSFVYLVLFI